MRDKGHEEYHVCYQNNTGKYSIKNNTSRRLSYTSELIANKGEHSRHQIEG